MHLYLITGNKHKFLEFKAAIPQVEQLDLDLIEIQEIDAQKVITAKLTEAFKYKQGEFIVEDTSLYLEGLSGLPGPLVKWFLKTIGNEGLANLTDKLENPNAIATSLIGYAKSIKDVYFFEGKVSGTITAPRGTHGFGWDPIFQPQRHHKTFAEMTEKEKNNLNVNMRKIAILKLTKLLG